MFTNNIEKINLAENYWSCFEDELAERLCEDLKQEKTAADLQMNSDLAKYCSDLDEASASARHEKAVVDERLDAIDHQRFSERMRIGLRNSLEQQHKINMIVQLSAKRALDQAFVRKAEMYVTENRARTKLIRAKTK